MTSPTIFGMNGSTLMAGGEAGPEAILPLRGFYKELENMLNSKFEASSSSIEKYLSVIAENSQKNIYLDDGTLVGKMAPQLDYHLGRIMTHKVRGI